jgi:hypothetical protein
MKNSPLTTLLLGLLLISALASLGLTYFYGNAVKERRQMQMQIAVVQQNGQKLGLLAAELQEYSKTHPAIDPLLESVGIKQAKAGVLPLNTTPSARTK